MMTSHQVDARLLEFFMPTDKGDVLVVETSGRMIGGRFRDGTVPRRLGDSNRIAATWGTADDGKIEPQSVGYAVVAAYTAGAGPHDLLGLDLAVRKIDEFLKPSATIVALLLTPSQSGGGLAGKIRNVVAVQISLRAAQRTLRGQGFSAIQLYGMELRARGTQNVINLEGGAWKSYLRRRIFGHQASHTIVGLLAAGLIRLAGFKGWPFPDLLLIAKR